MIYRYRPRLNEKINGYFICDTGRLSYKKENENRLYDNLLQGENKELFECIKEAENILNIHKKKCFFISPNLSIEEMFLLKNTADRFSCDLIVCTDEYEDKGFGDDFLRQNDLALNINAAKILGLHVSSYAKELVGDYDLNIFVDLKNINSWIELSLGAKKPCCTLCAFFYENLSNCLFSLAIASHTEKVGTFLTSGKMLQKSKGRVRKNQQARSLSFVLSRLARLPFSDEEELWRDGHLSLFEGFERAYDE